MRSVCNFIHPTIRQNSGFQPEQKMKPPLKEKVDIVMRTTNIPIVPVRIPVIVRRKVMKQVIRKDLDLSLKEMSLD